MPQLIEVSCSQLYTLHVTAGCSFFPIQVYNVVRLSELLPHLIHIEDETLIKPHWSDLESLFGRRLYDWSTQYTCHVWTRVGGQVPASPDVIKRLNSTIGQMMRYIYFGQINFVLWSIFIGVYWMIDRHNISIRKIRAWWLVWHDSTATGASSLISETWTH